MNKGEKVKNELKYGGKKMLEYRYYENFINYLNVDSILKIYKKSTIDIASNNIIVDSGSILRRNLNSKWVESTQKDTSAMGIEKWLMELGCKYNKQNKIRNRSISGYSEDEIMYDDMYRYICEKFNSIIKDYETLSVKKTKGEYLCFEEAVISGKGDLQYTLSHFLSCNFTIIRKKDNSKKKININVKSDTFEKQLENDIRMKLSIIV